MRTSTLLATVTLVLLSACGGSGGDPGSGNGEPPGSSVKFFEGDASATLAPVSLIFPPTGSPIDGELLGLATSAQLFLDALQELQDLHLALLYLVTPATIPVLDTALALDYVGRIQNPALDELIFDIWWPIHEDEVRALIAAEDTTITANAKSGQTSMMAYLPRTGRFGFVAPGVQFEVKRTFLGDGTADFDVAVETTADSPLQSQVLISIGNNIIEDLGTLTPGTQQRLERRLNRNEFDVRVEAQFVTTGDPFLRDLRVEVDFEAPPLQTRVAGVGFDLEGIGSIDQRMYNLTNPSAPMTTGEFAVLIAGGHHLELGLLTQIQYESTEARPQPVHPAETTYRASTIGVLDGYDGTWKAGARVSAPVVAALVSVGSWGISIANFDNATMTFEPDDVVETGNMTDLAPFDGDPESGRAVYVDNTADAIKFITRDAMQQYVLDPAAAITNAAWPGASGRVVSAFRHASGDLLFVTDGDPGEFWVLKPGETMATRIGNAGTFPRNIRAAGNIAAIGAYGSAFGFGSLSIYVRSGSGTWGLAPFSKVGSRSVGIDAKQLLDGRVAIAYPAFLNNKLNLTVVDGTTGEIRKDESLDLPPGCSNPGHCVFVRDDAVDAVLVSCNGSDNIVLLPVSYEEAP